MPVGREDVLAQLGSRVQHQLRAFTPNDADALKASVRTYPTSTYDLEKLLQELGIGEAVVTVMSEKGAPTPVAHAMLPAPNSKMAPSDLQRLEEIVGGSPLAPKYAEAVDRSSAYEMLRGEIAAGPGAPEPSQEPVSEEDRYPGMSEEERLEAEILGRLPERPPAPRREGGTTARRSPAPQPASGGESVIEAVLNSKTVQTLGTEILRGVFGNRRPR